MTRYGAKQWSRLDRTVLQIHHDYTVICEGNWFEMKLLFLYVNNNGLFHPLQANFTSESEFSFCIVDEKPQLRMMLNSRTRLPAHFFSSESVALSKDTVAEDCCVERIYVSGVVGQNGSGKSSMANVLAHMFTADFHEEFVAVFESGDTNKICYDVKVQLIPTEQ